MFTLCARGFDADALDVVEEAACHLNLRGMHNVSNACSAAAVARSLGMGVEVIARALEGALPESGRQEIVEARGGYTLVNDAYNANPDSMRASLAMFAALSVEGERIAVLGDMGELGDFARACHRGVGAHGGVAFARPPDLRGRLARDIAAGGPDGGMEEERVVCVDSVADVLEVLDARLEPVTRCW